jgi:hypothetical protein
MFVPIFLKLSNAEFFKSWAPCSPGVICPLSMLASLHYSGSLKSAAFKTNIYRKQKLVLKFTAEQKQAAKQKLMLFMLIRYKKTRNIN